ncbi:MAG: hypothetical protein LBV41_08525 [Cytophagaceae bacterium]|jgi:hypothetical protein|nr:hypothetical protein [Cytophagaceae bacterium]
MDKHLGLDIPEGKARKDFLDSNCDSVEKVGYTRRFSAAELAELKENLSETAIEINDIEIEKREVAKGFKKQLDPLNETKVELLEKLKDKSEHVNENCYKFIDYEAREVGFYNADGELVYSRPIQPQEMQKTVFQVQRTGTEN